MRVATRAGLRREGVLRGHGMRPPTAASTAVLARLATDPPLSEPEGFRALLNSFLPRKRAIAQMLVRDPDGRVLLCQLTYKRDWDLPGGVVEVGESPRLAVAREVEEELGARPSRPAACCSPTGCRRGAAGTTRSAWSSTAACTTRRSLDDVVLQAREIRSARVLHPRARSRERCADFTARRIESALRALAGGGTTYTESGRR